MEHLFGKKSKGLHTSMMVFECSFCRSKYYIGQGHASIQEMYEEIDTLLQGGCRKCGGRVIFKEHYRS